jgi:hypothetical protein
VLSFNAQPKGSSDLTLFQVKYSDTGSVLLHARVLQLVMHQDSPILKVGEHHDGSFCNFQAWAVRLCWLPHKAGCAKAWDQWDNTHALINSLH